MSHDLLFDMADKAALNTIKNPGWRELHAHMLRLCEKAENNGWKRRTGMTQNDRILKHIKATGSISQREAFLDYSIQSLTRRIRDLREAGYNIVSRGVTHPITKQRYTRYFLEDTATA